MVCKALINCLCRSPAKNVKSCFLYPYVKTTELTQKYIDSKTSSDQSKIDSIQGSSVVPLKKRGVCGSCMYWGKRIFILTSISAIIYTANDLFEFM